MHTELLILTDLVFTCTTSKFCILLIQNLPINVYNTEMYYKAHVG